MPSFCDRVGLMVGVPHAGHPVPYQWAWTLANLHPPMNFQTRFVNIAGRPVDVARNFIVQAARRENCKYLFYLGDDVTPPVHALRQLIYRMEQHPDWDVVGG